MAQLITPESFSNDRCERFRQLYATTLPKFIAQPHIVIGCGAIGGVICQILGQIGVAEIYLWDHDKVESVNMGPQGFSPRDMNTPKTYVREMVIKYLNPETNICSNPKRFATRQKHPENAYWWLMVDDLDVREQIFETALKYSPEKIIDARMGGLVYEVYNVLRKPEKYPETIQFARDNPVREGCTTRSTPHCAMVAGAISVNLALAELAPFCVKGDMMAYNQEVIW